MNLVSVVFELQTDCPAGNVCLWKAACPGGTRGREGALAGREALALAGREALLLAKEQGLVCCLVEKPWYSRDRKWEVKMSWLLQTYRGFGDRARSWSQQLAGHYFSDILVKNRKIADSLFILALPRVSRGPDKDRYDF